MFVVFLDKTLGNELDNDDGRCHFLKGVMWIYEFMRFSSFGIFFFFFFICGKMGEIDDENGGKLSGVEFANVCLCYGSITMVPNFIQRGL
jgi:hypothetical protein